MIRSLGVIVLAALFFQPAGATTNEAASIKLSLDEAITMAVEANPGMQAVRANTKASESLAQAELNRWLGELTLRGGVAINGDDTLIRPITSEMLAAGVADMPFDDKYAFWSLAYRVPIYGGGSVTGTRESARLGASASGWNLQRATLGLRHQVLTTQVELLSIDVQIAAWQEERAALESLESHIELGQEAGKYSRVDLLKTSVERQNSLSKVRSLQMERDTKYAMLMAQLGEGQTTIRQYDLEPVEVGSFDAPLPPAHALLDSALARRSDLKALRNVASAQRANAGVVGSHRLPQVSIGGNLSGAHGGTIDFDDTYWSVNATVSVPLFDMGWRKNLSAKADQTARGAEMNVLDLKGRIRAEVAAALALVANSRSNIENQETTLELAREVSRLEQLRYDSGRGDVDNLLKSRSGMRVAEAALARARHDLLIALNHLQLTIEGECR